MGKKEKHMINIDAELWERLEAASEEEGESISALISIMVEIGLDRLEGGTLRSRIAG